MSQISLRQSERKDNVAITPERQGSLLGIRKSTQGIVLGISDRSTLDLVRQ